MADGHVVAREQASRRRHVLAATRQEQLMALQPCSECSHRISDRALACPACGRPVSSRPNNEHTVSAGGAACANATAAAAAPAAEPERFVACPHCRSRVSVHATLCPTCRKSVAIFMLAAREPAAFGFGVVGAVIAAVCGAIIHDIPTLISAGAGTLCCCPCVGGPALAIGVGVLGGYATGGFAIGFALGKSLRRPPVSKL
jgi:hypothetical protein